MSIAASGARSNPGRAGTLFLDDEDLADELPQEELLPEGHDGDGHRHALAGPWPARRARLVAMVVLAAVVAIPVTLVATAESTVTPPPLRHDSSVPGPADGQVLGALSATTRSGSFDMAYSITLVRPAGSPAPSCTAPAHSPTVGATCGGPAVTGGTVAQGTGVIDTSPMAMVAGADVGGPGGLKVTVRVDGSRVWEPGGSGTSLPAPPGTGTDPGTPLAKFGSLVESTLGVRAGAVAMMGMASPTGYLDLTQPEITGATTAGQGTVGGVPVAFDRVSLDVARLAATPGVTSSEQAAIQAALGVLEAQGYQGTTVTLGIDAAGYIREARTVTAFSDGWSVVLAATFGNFGCAGRVLMPGQTGPTSAPAGCVSPDRSGTPTGTVTGGSGTRTAG